MTESTTATHPPKTDMKPAGPCKFEVQVEIAAEQVKEMYEKKYADLAREVQLPGFRRGHTPRKLIERRFGKDVANDVKFTLFQEFYEKFVEEKKLQPLGEPDVSLADLTVAEDQPFAFKFNLEVHPTVELPATVLDDLKAVRPRVDVPEAEIDRAIEGIRESRAELVPLAGEGAAEGDHLTVEEELFFGGKRLMHNESAQLVIRKDLSIFGNPAPDLVVKLAGIKPEGRVEVTVKLPEDFQDAEARGKEATLKLHVLDTKRRILPEVNDAWAKQFDFDNVGEMRAEARKKLEASHREAGERKVEEQLFDALLGRVTIELPDRLIDAGTQQFEQRVRVQNLMQGIPEAVVEEELKKISGESRDSVIRQLRLHYLVEKLAEREKLFVTEDLVTERINAVAAQAKKWPHEIQAYLEERDLMRDLRASLREEQVRALLKKKAAITDAPAGETVPEPKA